MAKDNLFLGFGRGSVGDVVFSRLGGQQVARARNRSPKNPQTPLQLLQRVVLKTASTGYSMFQDIVNHSFQGYQEGTDNQSRFVALNVAKMRDELAVEINSGNAEDILNSINNNYAFKNSSLAQYRSFIMSEGTLQPLNFDWYKYGDTMSAFILHAPGSFTIPVSAETGLTYKQFCEWLGLSRGDQLTFCFADIDDTDESGEFNAFNYARVILEPPTGDMSTSFVNLAGEIENPNERNEGVVYFTPVREGSSGGLYLSVRGSHGESAGTSSSMAAACVIVSRQSGGVWQRSSASLVLRPYTTGSASNLRADHGINFLGDAIRSYITDAASSLYLNQAE